MFPSFPVKYISFLMLKLLAQALIMVLNGANGLIPLQTGMYITHNSVKMPGIRWC